MPPLSAVDAILPAFTRTQSLLFSPFRFGRSWKLAASSYLAFLGSAFFPAPLLLLVIPWSSIPSFPHMRLLVMGAILGYTLLLFVLFFFGIRMEFVEFGVASTEQRFIAPLWRQTGPRTWPWLGLKAALGSVLALLALPLLAHATRAFIVLFCSIPATAPGSRLDPATNEWAFSLMSQILWVYFGLFIYFILLKLSSTILHDFVLPFYLLEPAPLRRSLELGWNLCRADALAVTGYLAMKYLLALLGAFAQYILAIVLMIPGGLVFGVLAVLGEHLLSQGPVPSVLLVVGIVLLYLLFIAYVFYCQIFCIGCLCTFLECYGVVFTGSRYQRLADLLQPPPPPFQDDSGN